MILVPLVHNNQHLLGLCATYSIPSFVHVVDVLRSVEVSRHNGLDFVEPLAEQVWLATIDSDVVHGLGPCTTDLGVSRFELLDPVLAKRDDLMGRGTSDKKAILAYEVCYIADDGGRGGKAVRGHAANVIDQYFLLCGSHKLAMSVSLMAR